MNEDEIPDMTDVEYKDLLRTANTMLASEPEDDVKVGRNERCPCGSGKKYKQCCIDKPEPFVANPEPANDNKPVSSGVLKSVLPFLMMSLMKDNMPIIIKKDLK